METKASKTFPLLFAALLSALAALSGCSDDKEGEEFNFERQPQGFKAETEGTGDSIHLVLSWEAPANLEGFAAYRLWAVLTEETGDAASFVSRQTGFSGDLDESSLPAGVRLWTVPADSATGGRETWRIPDEVGAEAAARSLGVVRWLLWAEYSGSRTPGNRVSTRVYYRDVFPPEPVVPAVTPYADSAVVEWDRPFDLADNLEPNRSGMIFGYRLVLSALTTDFSARKPRFAAAAGFEDRDLLLNSSINPLGGGAPVTKEEIVSVPATDEEVSVVLLDGKVRSADPDSNRLSVVVRNLKPKQDYRVRIVPFDSLGVLRDLDDNPVEARNVKFTTTDASTPVFFPEFRLKETDEIGVRELAFKPAADEESGIAAYLFRRIDSDTVEGRADTLSWEVAAEDLRLSSGRYSETLRNLFPGVLISVSATARDSSGHLSLPVDTVFSLPSRTSLECPAGMTGVKGADSLPDFCMDRFEHREGGKFVAGIRWSEARGLCRSLSDGSASFDLCSEAQWVRACTEGTGRKWGLLESDEEKLPSTLMRECAAGSGDSSTASSASLRSLACATGDGVRDLPGQYQEWVVGPAADSMRIKGGSWMRPAGEDQTTVLSLATCNARAVGVWNRPKFALRGGHDTLFVFYGDSVRFSVPASDTAMKRRVADTLVWTEGDSVQAFAVYAHPDSMTLLGRDTLQHLPTRTGWIEANANGLDYRKEGSPLPAFVWGTRTVDPGGLYQHRSVSFRCCAVPAAEP